MMSASRTTTHAEHSRWHEYLLLMRLDKPVGILLLLWPVLWALWLAAEGPPSGHLLTVFILGTVLTRSAGCIINDFADRDIDPHVERTRERPLAARRVSPYEALTLFVVLMLSALALVLTLDTKTALMSLVAGFLLMSYPLFKRFFPAPQLYLGMAFGWGVPMAFMAVTGAVGLLGWLLFAITLLWALIYDTYYAMVDREDDRRIGIHSTALLFGKADLAILASLQILMVTALWKLGELAGLSGFFHIALIVAALLFIRFLWLARARDRAGCFRAFRENHYVGLVMLCGIVLAIAQR